MSGGEAEPVLAAIAVGHNTHSGIAAYIGRKSDQIAHPLNVLEDCALIRREPDLFRAGRTRYRIVEPLITFYEAIMRRRWAELEARRAEQVWTSVRHSFSARVVGPHFESLCRDFALNSGAALFRGYPAEVASGTVNDVTSRAQIEIDVVVLAPQEAHGPRKVLSLGEAKWGEVMGREHLERLGRARELLTRKGYDTTDTILACYGGNGFSEELLGAAKDEGVLLVGLEDLHRPTD